MAETRIGDVPCREAGDREGDAREKPDADNSAGLPSQEGLDALAPSSSATGAETPERMWFPVIPTNAAAEHNAAASQGAYRREVKAALTMGSDRALEAVEIGLRRSSGGGL